MRDFYYDGTVNGGAERSNLAPARYMSTAAHLEKEEGWENVQKKKNDTDIKKAEGRVSVCVCGV